MRPTITVLEDIPPLAWLVEVRDPPRIILGGGVDLRRRDGRLELTEGCWEGDFAASDVSEARHLFGSGIVVDAQGLLFCTACHTSEALYACRRSGALFVSNSLAFVARVGEVPLGELRGIYRRAHTLLGGIAGYDTVLHDGAAHQLLRYAHCNLRFRNGRAEILDKAATPPLADYAGYKRYLSETLAAIRDNAAAGGRRRSYRLLASISSGYDSAACAALLAPLGCDRAVTLRTGRGGMVDSGRPVAEALGMHCVEVERRIPPAAGRLVEADFIAAFDGGDSVFAAFADLLPGTLLATGHLGGGIWDPTNDRAGSLGRLDSSGMGLQEFRLRTDFLNLQVPAIGATRDADLRRIGLSDEMRPFAVGGAYDRPIPRRIVEEAGVPRALFGQHKKAVNVNLWHAERMMTEECRRSIEAFVAARVGTAASLRERAARGAQHLLDLVSGFREDAPGRFFNRIGFLRRRGRRWNRAFSKRWGTMYRPYFDHTYAWALAVVGERYAPALAALGDEDPAAAETRREAV